MAVLVAISKQRGRRESGSGWEGTGSHEASFRKWRKGKERGPREEMTVTIIVHIQTLLHVFVS